MFKGICPKKAIEELGAIKLLYLEQRIDNIEEMWAEICNFRQLTEAMNIVCGAAQDMYSDDLRPQFPARSKQRRIKAESDLKFIKLIITRDET